MNALQMQPVNPDQSGFTVAFEFQMLMIYMSDSFERTAMSSLNNLKDEFIQNFDMIKSDGEFFGAFFTTAGMVDLLCGVEISDSGKELHLKDIAIYPQKNEDLKGLAIKEILKLSRVFEDAAWDLGFRYLRITGHRHEQSTSANPGHLVVINIDLAKRSKRRDLK